MAITDNKIGQFKFIALQGNASAPSEQLAVDQRIGVDGTEITQTGRRGVPFTMRSQVDVPSIETGEQRYREYLALTGQNPVDVVKDGVSSNAGDWKAQVLEVRLVRLVALTASVGGIEENPQAFLVCDWTLLAVAN